MFSEKDKHIVNHSASELLDWSHTRIQSWLIVMGQGTSNVGNPKPYYFCQVNKHFKTSQEHASTAYGFTTSGTNMHLCSLVQDEELLERHARFTLLHVEPHQLRRQTPLEVSLACLLKRLGGLFFVGLSCGSRCIQQFYFDTHQSANKTRKCIAKRKHKATLYLLQRGFTARDIYCRLTPFHLQLHGFVGNPRIRL